MASSAPAGNGLSVDQREIIKTICDIFQRTTRNPRRLSWPRENDAEGRQRKWPPEKPRAVLSPGAC